jgi:predicted nucleic acid-binding protein
VTLYVDASALAKLYVEEPESDVARKLLLTASWTAARHDYVEVRRTLQRRLARDRLARARALFEESWRETNTVELDESTCLAAADLAERFGVKTLDALHLAAAQRAGGSELTFVTFDERQAAAARALGWTVAGV